MSDPKQKIKVIEDSLRCHRRGWLSLIPFAGIPFGISTLVLRWKIRRTARELEWNPAAPQLLMALLTALLGGFLSLIEWGLLIVAMFHLMSGN